MDDDLTSLTVLDDESSSGNLVRLSAIHALMAISEPMGYNDMFSPRLDDDRIVYNDLNSIDGQYNFNNHNNPNFNENNQSNQNNHNNQNSQNNQNHNQNGDRSGTLDSNRGINNSNSNNNSNNADLNYDDTGVHNHINSNHNSSNNQNNQNNQNDHNYLFQKNVSQNNFSYQKNILESLSSYRKCLFEGCDEKVLLTLHEEHSSSSLVKEDEEDRVYRQSVYCKKHLLGSRKCEYEGCDKCAQGSTKFCIKHGGNTISFLS